MTASSLNKTGLLLPKGFLTVPLVVTYLALSALSVHSGIEAMFRVVEPVENASGESSSSADAALLLAGDSSR